ncbi:glycoside hydrolase family 16 protein [Trametes coccinea BRFM310]|uniref:Glycoside hydrolase family 16 protein n=1 Tax=Trametes coccinea (strain BRFM310) TaxID=1353009 RepID=A0A1Y2J433_TRAC3|nr:glycoside hydrolase family 16 protein [Trametes coccinea BRFM310]
MLFRRSVVLATSLTLVGSAMGYDLVRDYSGQNFFDGWDFYGSWDNLTLSQVWWVNETRATSEHLAYVNDAGRAILRVDNTTNLPPNMPNRDTIRITTKDYYDFGSLWVFDATHLPYGCSVWPAFWTKGPNWPFDGEIDIVEGINLQKDNQMAVHTTQGCTTSNSIVQSGSIGFTDCSHGSGCTVRENKPNSFGQNFAQNGGGVWATQYDVAGVFIWYWPRSDVPAELTSNASSIDISSWGTPSAAFPVTPQCNLTEFFTPQQLVLDIALCGDWAGVQSIYSSTCPGTCNVTGPGSPAYDNAWFEINYVRAFTTGGPAPTSTSTTSAPTGSTTSIATVIATVTSTAGSGSPTGSGSGSSQNDTNAAVRAAAVGVHAVGAVLLSLVAGVVLAAW